MRYVCTHRMFYLPLVGLLMLCMPVYAGVTEKAGTTIANAPYITDRMVLEVQSGANYIRVESSRLPATVTYMPQAPFGTIPTAIIMGDTLPAQIYFDDCSMGWIWTIPEDETTALVEILAHEPALIEAVPYACEPPRSEQTEEECDSLFWNGEWRKESRNYEYVTKNAAGCDSIITLHLTINHATKGDTTATACEMFVWHGTTYTESAEPTFTLTNSRGCDSIVTLYLTIEHNCGSYDTAYFCRGFNSEHEELMAGGITRRYRPYVFKSPAEWNYMEGVILEGAHDRTLVDLAHAEANLYEYYKGELTPISSIRWSVMYDGKGKYEPLTVTDGPQWIATGYIAVQVCFLCGEMYNTEFPTDIDQLSTGTVSIKRIENGRVVIIRGGAKYDMFGTKIQ